MAPTGEVRPLRLAHALLYTADKLKQGCPSVYKLKMREEMRQKLKSAISRQSIGNPEEIKLHGNNEKVFLLVGATGAGKSTLINGMMNYIMDIEWDDNLRFQLITEDDKASQACSQTQDITAYTVYPMTGSKLPYTFTVIDTPGFGATEGLRRDKEITRQIKEFFSLPFPQGIDHIDGIGFVVQSSQARLTQAQKYIFDSILSIFGKDVSKNFFMMITFADGQRPPVLDAIKKAEMPHHVDRHFKFNNSALFAQNDTAAENEMNFDEMFWKLGMRSFQLFFDKLQKSESVSLQLTQEVLQEREVLYVVLEGLNGQICFGLNKLEEIRQEENIIQQREKEIETNKDFTYEVEVVKQTQISLEGTGQHTTTCLVCNSTCHENCRIADDDDKERCWAMSEGKCRICPRKCIWSSHKNRPYIIKEDLVKEERTSAQLRQKYLKAVEGKASSSRMLNQIETNLQQVHIRVLEMIKTAQKSVRRLDEIALKPNPLTGVEYIELLIESEKNEANLGWKNRVAYYEEALKHAKLLSKVTNEQEMQELILQELIQKPVERRRKWYQRFKFW